MRLHRIPGAIALLGVVACGDHPTSPHAPSASAFIGSSPRFDATAAVQQRGEGVFVSSGDYSLNCLNEVVREPHTEIAFRFHLTVTPSGNTILTDPFVPNSGTGTLIGLTSGTIWTLDRVVSPDVIRVTAGEMSQFTANIWWVSETGPTLNIHSLFHVSTNANGEVTSAKVDLGDCKLH